MDETILKYNSYNEQIEKTKAEIAELKNTNSNLKKELEKLKKEMEEYLIKNNLQTYNFNNGCITFTKKLDIVNKNNNNTNNTKNQDEFKPIKIKPQKIQKKNANDEYALLKKKQDKKNK